jgi:hypothetical protein
MRPHFSHVRVLGSDERGSSAGCNAGGRDLEELTRVGATPQGERVTR